MSDRSTLLAACLDSPADDTARLVYADWLREQDNPATQALGRFIWAGVTLAGFRGSAPVEDGMFFDAQKELNETAPRVLAAQLKTVLGWEWEKTVWDSGDKKPDEVMASRFHDSAPGGYRMHPGNVRRGADAIKRLPCVTYSRGMLCGLRLTLATWREVAASVLAACPLERVEVLDVPGLVLRVLREPDERWRLAGELRLSAIPPSAVFGPSGSYTAPASPATTLTEALPERGFHERSALVEEIGLTTEAVATCLRLDADDRWPGPELSVAFPHPDYTQADIDESDEQHRLNNPHYHQPEQWQPEDLYEDEVSGPIDSEDM